MQVDPQSVNMQNPYPCAFKSPAKIEREFPKFEFEVVVLHAFLCYFHYFFFIPYSALMMVSNKRPTFHLCNCQTLP